MVRRTLETTKLAIFPGVAGGSKVSDLVLTMNYSCQIPPT
jgi:hypothetical protein